MAAIGVNDLLDAVLPEIDNRFRREAKEWPLVKRNQAITSRNRAMREISAMLGMEFVEMPLESAP